MALRHAAPVPLQAGHELLLMCDSDPGCRQARQRAGMPLGFGCGPRVAAFRRAARRRAGSAEIGFWPRPSP
jgi:hypothetical protein